MSSQVVVITGASSGFGQACAEHLAGLGHRVYGTSRSATFPKADAPPTAGPLLIPMDVRDDASVRAALDFVLEREGRLDVVVNNAGVGLAGSVEDSTPEEARDLFETNLFGVHRVCRAVLPTLRKQGSGLIVNVSSLGGLLTIPFQGFYSASKFALESMSEALRMEVKPFGIRVILLEPGDFKTGFTENRIFAASASDGSLYAERCNRAIAVMENDEQNGADPIELARLLARLMEQSSPRLRHPIGMWFQKALVGARRVLPDGLLEKGIMGYYKL